MSRTWDAEGSSAFSAVHRFVALDEGRQLHSDSPHNAEAIVALGHRHEQLDRREQAAEFYQLYLSRYAESDDARALGQRGVCLARSVDNEKRVGSLLVELKRKRSFARDGFVSPPVLGLAQLCSALPPVNR